MIKAMRTIVCEMLPVGLPEFIEEPTERYIGNSNTMKFHEPGCHCIDRMLDEHKVGTDGFGYSPCGFCACKTESQIEDLKQVTLEMSVDNSKDPEDVEICRDPRINKIFKDSECVTCGHTEGTVKMYPAEHGVRLLGDPHKRYWIYKECSRCGYQTSFRKLKMKS